jgi:hypothetical protein
LVDAEPRLQPLQLQSGGAGLDLSAESTAFDFDSGGFFARGGVALTGP